jgi:phosphoribosylformylglycinamidine synthase
VGAVTASGCVLRSADSLEAFSKLCTRENALFAVVGTVTADGVVTLVDSSDDSVPLQLDLETFLGDLPQKTFESTSQEVVTRPLSLPPVATSTEALELSLDRVLRHLSVASKRFLTNKVDRSVTGKVAQQQCVGPLQLPLGTRVMKDFPGLC